MPLEYCIWGCGNRGKNIDRFMGGKGVRAFIDQNPALQGTTYQGRPVIGFDEFLRDYSQCAVIVSPLLHQRDIQRILEQKHIRCLSSLFLPPEVAEVPVPDLYRLIDQKLREGGVYLYGLNLFSILLLEHYRAEGLRPVQIVPEEGAERWLVEAVEDSYPGGIAALEEAENLYLTSNRCVTEEAAAKNPINIYDFLYDVDGYYNPETEKQKGIYQGKRCFILGTGPSLQYEDLDRLKENEELCISVNEIVHAYAFTAWRPDYYVVTDKMILELYKDTLLQSDESGYVFVSDTALRGMPTHEKFHRFHVSLLEVSESCPTLFSRDFARGAYAGGMVIYAAIQLAVYMGCSELYLYGVDFDYSNPQKNHFVEDTPEWVTKDIPNRLPQALRHAAISFASARKAAEQIGVRIYNASRRSKLDIFERVDFDSLF